MPNKSVRKRHRTQGNEKQKGMDMGFTKEKGS